MHFKKGKPKAKVIPLSKDCESKYHTYLGLYEPFKKGKSNSIVIC